MGRKPNFLHVTKMCNGHIVRYWAPDLGKRKVFFNTQYSMQDVLKKRNELIMRLGLVPPAMYPKFSTPNYGSANEISGVYENIDGSYNVHLLWDRDGRIRTSVYVGVHLPNKAQIAHELQLYYRSLMDPVIQLHKQRVRYIYYRELNKELETMTPSTLNIRKIDLDIYRNSYQVIYGGGTLADKVKLRLEDYASKAA